MRSFEDLIAETVARGGEVKIISEDDNVRCNKRVVAMWKWPGMNEWQQAAMQFSPGDCLKEHIKHGLGLMLLDIERWFEKFEPPMIKLINVLTKNPWRHV